MESAVIAVLGLTAIGCGTAIVLRVLSIVSDARRRALEHSVQLLQEQLRQRELRIGELEHVNHLLEQQVEWHVKLLGSAEQPARLVSDGGLGARSA